MKQTLLVASLLIPFHFLHAQNVGVGTPNPQQKLDVAGNIRLDDNMMVEGNSSYRVYRNLGTYNNTNSAAAGAFVINTTQPWNSACMFRVEIEGYFYDATAPFEISVGGYMYVGNDFYNYGYINTGSKKLQVRLAKSNSTNTIAVILGDETASYSYPKISVVSFMQGHSNISEAYADGWTVSQVTTLSNFSYIVSVPDVTQSAPSGGSDNYIQNQNVVAQAANYWISGIGKSSQYQLTNANTSLTQGSGNALRVTTNSGFTEIGAQNGSWSHFATDRPRFYFNKGVTVDEGLIGSYDEDLSLQTSGITRVTVQNSTGNVGIGITTPATLLHISGAHSTTRARLTLPSGNNGGGTGEINMQLWVSEPGITWDAGGIGTNVTNDGGSPAGFSRINTSLGQSYIRFITNGGAMAFNTTNNAGTYYQTMYMVDGNVGVGTTAPSEKLHVAGNIRVGGNYAINSEGDHLSIMYGTRADDDSYEWIGYYSNGTRQGIILYDGAWSGANSLTNEFSLTAEGNNLLTLNTSNNHVALMPKNGNVGVGTLSPGEKLDVSGNVKASGIVYWGNGSVRTESRDDAGLRGDAGARSGFFETSAPSPSSNWPTGASSWWHLLDVRHSNNANNYAMQIAGSFFDQNLYYRKTSDNAAQAWSKLLTPSNTYGSNNQSVIATTDISTASSSFTTIPGMTITFTPVHSTVYVTFSGAGNYTGTYSAAQYAHFQIVKDGVAVKGGSCSVGEFDDYDGGHNTWNIHLSYPLSVTAGVSTTVRVDWAYFRYFSNQTLWIRPSVEPIVHHRHLYILD